MIRIYFVLTKPGIVLGNLITTGTGFILASNGHLNLWLFLATLFGLGFIMASACVFNNAIDRDADQKMARTKDRALVKGQVSLSKALFFAISLGVIGCAIMAAYTNFLAAGISLLGFFIYVVAYSLWKYRSTHATLIGSIAGAVPPLVGYVAVSGRIDAGALILFAIVLLWQMPHFYSIAVYRLDDYISASIPVLPITKGMYFTKVTMFLYIIAFILTTLLLIAFGYSGYAYLISALFLGFAWLGLCLLGFKAKNDQRWARQMFQLSLVVITVLSILISVDIPK